MLGHKFVFELEAPFVKVGGQLGHQVLYLLVAFERLNDAFGFLQDKLKLGLCEVFGLLI